MAQWLREVAALAKDSGLIPSIYMAAQIFYNSSSMEIQHPFLKCSDTVCIWCLYRQADAHVHTRAHTCTPHTYT